VRRADSYPVQGAERPLRLVRRETVMTEHYRRPEEESQGGGGRGMSGKAVIESPERAPVPVPRRASYQGSHYTHVSQSPRGERVVERIPARSYASGRDGGARPKYVEYVAQEPRALEQPSVARIDDKSYVSQRPSRTSQTSRARSRSEGPRYERPLTILPAQSEARSPVSHVSHRSSYKTAESRREGSPSRSRKSGSHVSSRSYHSVSTAKVSPSPPTTTTRIQVVPSERERRSMHSDRRSSVVERARNVPLPTSVASGMGYAASVAPSDSVSSVGVKRERERLRERMSIRDGVSRGW